MVQLSHPYMITGKTIGLIRWTFVGKVMSLLFNMLSRFVTVFLPRSKHLTFTAAVTAMILEPKKIKSVTAATFPIYLPWSDGSGCRDLSEVVSSAYLKLLIFLPAILIPLTTREIPWTILENNCLSRTCNQQVVNFIPILHLINGCMNRRYG